MLMGLKLTRFLEGTNIRPCFQPNANSQDKTFNPEYLKYEEQD